MSRLSPRRRPGQGGTFRTIPLDDSLRTLLHDYRAKRRERFGPVRPGDALFTDTRGAP